MEKPLLKDNLYPDKNMRVENPLMQPYLKILERKIMEESFKEIIKEIEKSITINNKNNP